MARRGNRTGAVAVAATCLVAAVSWFLLQGPRAAPGDEGPRLAPGSGGDVVAPSSGGSSPGPAGAAPGVSPEAEQATDEERRDGEELESRMAKLVRDLEFSPGQKEPPQQLVEPQPEPWKRDPSREGPSPAIEAIVPRRAGAGGGERITIRGRNLRVVQVMFGSAPARLLSARGDEVIVEAPPGAAGPVTVAVTNDDGTWVVASEPFVYGD